MTNKITLKKSSVSDKVPVPGDLEYGELALNYNDGNLFYKNSSNLITTIASNKFVSVTGNVTGSYFIGNGSQLTGIVATAAPAGNANEVQYNGGGVTAASPNFTFTGTDVSVTGNVSVTGQLRSTVATGTAPLVVSSTTQVANLYSARAGTADNVSVNVGDGFLAVVAAGSGNLPVRATNKFTANSTTGVLTGITFSGNLTGTTASVTGNVTGGNLVTLGTVYAKDALFTGNLTVDGDVTYVNITSLNIEDPLISIGGGSNGAPLTSNDGKDRGEALNYFNTAGNVAKVAFIGYQNSSGKIISATDVSIANDVVTVNTYGTSVVGALEGTTVSVTGTITGGNIATGGTVSATGNITGGNILGGANVNATTFTGSTVSVTGTITGGNLATAGTVSATGTITGGNIATGGTVSATGNITGGNILGGANVNATTFTGSTVSVTGTITGGNLATGGTASATGNITTSGQFIGSGAGLTSIPGGNVSGAVANATYATSAGSATSATTAGTVTTAAQPNITSVGTLTSVSVSGNITGGNLLISGSILDASQLDIQTTAANANIVLTPNGTGQVNISSALSVTGSITGGNLATGGTASATGTITGGNIATAGTVSATGTITGGNLATGGTVSATGNITGGNLTGGGITLSSNTISSTGATLTIDPAAAGVTGTVIIAGNLTVQGTTTTYDSTTVTINDLVFTVANNAATASAANGGGIEVGPVGASYASWTYDQPNSRWSTALGIAATGTITGGNLATGGTASATGTITGGNLATAGTVSATGTITGGNIATGGTISATGNITGGNVLGGANVNATTHTGTTVSVTGTITGGNLATGGTASATGTITGGNIATAGTVSATGTITGGNLATGGTISATGNITGGNILGGANVNATTHTGTTVSVTGNVTGGGLVGTLYTNSIINTGANLTGNIGSSTLYFNTAFVKATSAQYADLAENYLADAPYDPGTVVSFGGTEEVTISNKPNDRRVAGVVTSNPSYVMNAGLTGNNVVCIGLIGRVPTKVLGPIQKGDFMVSAGNGYACACSEPAVGTVIGKAVQDFAGLSGVIEILINNQ